MAGSFTNSDGTGPTTYVPIEDLLQNEVLVNGSPVSLSVTLEVTGRASANFGQTQAGTSHGMFVGDFGDTLTWGGITSVAGLDGEPITDWTVTSASGFDYSKPFGAPRTVHRGAIDAGDVYGMVFPATPRRKKSQQLLNG